MPVSSKFHVASRILLHSSWNMCNQANTLPWSISVLCGKVCVPRRTHDLCTQLQESTRPILHILLSVSLSVSYSVSQPSGRKGCWLIGPRSNDVGHNTPLVIGCDRRACATMFNLQTGHHWGGHHWSFLLSFFYLYVRSLDISECQRTPGMQRMRINCLEDAPLPFTFPISLCRWCGAVLLIHSPVFSGLRLYRFDLHMQSLYWLYLLVLSISAAYIVVAADRSRSQSLSAWVKRLGQRTDIRQMFKEK